ncbi:conserved hypothetical protein [Paecilomyces variotii No. 5]|uniref:Tubulin-specific chaperone A n=1 Tax=Byssochlamys spectabilis (strain No. 5 / NBRC 109023) TaxID=1356009 RepID=V5I5T4_BYSSN|nr:conserved hypothetical protein [Paecilomyces variotii No. 5]
MSSTSYSLDGYQDDAAPTYEESLDTSQFDYREEKKELSHPASSFSLGKQLAEVRARRIEDMLETYVNPLVFSLGQTGLYENTFLLVPSNVTALQTSSMSTKAKILGFPDGSPARLIWLIEKMAPPSPLSIATSSLQRLVKEEASYHRELQQQEQRVQRLEAETGPDEDGNREYALNQERRAVEETKAVLPTLKPKVSAALQKLEALLVEEGQKGDQSNVEQINAAKDAVAQAKTALREVS